MSEDGPRIIALVGAREHILKSQRFTTIASTLKHFRKVSSSRKKTYLKAFTRRYARLYNYLEIARVLTYSVEAMNKINQLLSKIKPALSIVDDKLYSEVNYPVKLRESKVRKRHLENLVTITDNLANYFRVLLKDNPKKFREELRRFEK